MAVTPPPKRQFRGFDDFPDNTRIGVPHDEDFWWYQAAIADWCCDNLGTKWHAWTMRADHLCREIVVSTLDPHGTALLRMVWL